MRYKHSLVAFLIATSGCSDGGVFVGELKGSTASTAKTDDSTKDADTEAPASEDEKSQPPQIVSGMYLAQIYISCADAPAGSGGAGANDAVAGCSLAEKGTNKLVELAAIATKWKWNVAQSIASKPIDARVVETADDDVQQVYVIASGSQSNDELLSSLDLSTITIELTPKAEAGIPTRSFTNRVKEAKAKTVYSEAGDAPPPSSEQERLTPGDIDEDRDQDGVLEKDGDVCSNTPKDAKVWKTGKWRGCTGGEYNDNEDQDTDRVPNQFDKCPGTALGRTVVLTVGDPRRGCSELQR